MPHEYGYDGPYGYAPYGYGFDDVVGPPVILSVYRFLPDITTLVQIRPTLQYALGPLGLPDYPGYGYDAQYGYAPYGYGFDEVLRPHLESAVLLRPAIDAPTHLRPTIRYVEQQ